MGNVHILYERPKASRGVSSEGRDAGEIRQLRADIASCVGDLREKIGQLAGIVAGLDSNIQALPPGYARTQLELSRTSIMLQLDAVRLILAQI